MGNTLGGKRRTKVMKINGETMKLKTPVQAGAVTKDYPGFVLLDSEAVKHFGVRAKPLGLYQELKPKRLYFLVELPKIVEDNKLSARRVQSGINMSAKDRLETLMLAKRSISDLSLMQQKSSIVEESSKGGAEGMRVKVRLPRSEVNKLMRENKTDAEVAEKIMQLCLDSSKGETGVADHLHSKEGGEERASQGTKMREKRVGFLPINEEKRDP